MTDAIGKAEDYVKQNGNGLKRKRVYKKPVKRRKVVKKKARKTIKRPKRTLKKKKNIDFF
jgi:hypothetical protein